MSAATGTASVPASRKKSSISLFERSTGGILNLRYDSQMLEDYYEECSRPSARARYRFSTMFTGITCLAWIVFFAAFSSSLRLWYVYVVGLSVCLCLAAIFYGLSFTGRLFLNNRHALYLSFSSALLIFLLLSFAPPTPSVSLVFNAALSLKYILILYTMMPVRLWHAVLFNCLLSVGFILATALHLGVTAPRLLLLIVVMHAAVHGVGLMLHLMSQSRRRSTFLRLGQSAVLKERVKIEQKSQNDMIQSLMPAQIATEVMDERRNQEQEQEKEKKGGGGGGARMQKRRQQKHRQAGNRTATFCKIEWESTDDEQDDGQDQNGEHEEMRRESGPHGINDMEMTQQKRPSIAEPAQSAEVKFRTFHVSQLENVSILFADIVGFTKMSSNKTAKQLVILLNDLFGRFDELCEQNECEKIATLGDCYYCVSGCPNPDERHAEKCVEMGRSMCTAIQQFDVDHKEEVNMRVGVHTGTVICGIVGTRRFKFDVWSNDVTLANEMESSGEAGRVHISESTYSFVKDIYEVEAGEEIPDIRNLKVLIEYFDEVTKSYRIKHRQDEATIKTFFILNRFDGKSELTLPQKTEEELRQMVEEHPAQPGTSPPPPSSGEFSNSGETKEASEHSKLIVSFKPGEQSGDGAAGDDLEKTEYEGTAGGVTSLTTPEQNEILLAQVSDAEMIRMLRKDEQPKELFFRPPVNRFTLSFRDPHLEKMYHRTGLRIPRKRKTVSKAVSKAAMAASSSSNSREGGRAALTWATNRITPLIDMITFALFYILILIACGLAFPYGPITSPSYLVGFFVASLVLFIPLFATLLYDVLQWGDASLSFYKFYTLIFSWYPRNLVGFFLLAIPSVLVLANFRLCAFKFINLEGYQLCLGLLFITMLCNYSLFTMYSAWTKIVSATFTVIVSALLVFHQSVAPSVSQCTRDTINISSGYLRVYKTGSPLIDADLTLAIRNGTPLRTPGGNGATLELPTWIYGTQLIPAEIVLSLVLFWMFICALNYEFDVGFRANFNCDYQAKCARQTMVKAKQQADWLLENIIPKYSIGDIKTKAKYSKQRNRVGVIFATLANFSEFYDEQFEGGREMLRVLNEIFADFEQLLSQEKYRHVEKIKTIGACFMAASGLDPEYDNDREKDAHLTALMDFSKDLLRVLDSFNQQIFNFNFELKIGYNVGNVTAGVIGTTKLLYDIWGDTVNVASRMYSTGATGCIQVTEEVAEQLKDKYNFKYRGVVSVKGKGQMRTYLVDPDQQPTATLELDPGADSALAADTTPATDAVTDPDTALDSAKTA